eukprot:13986097-Alexandrium_andersonii.AAC.1
MSASLVGSEMCIRDSTQPPPLPTRRRERSDWDIRHERPRQVAHPEHPTCLLYTSDAADDM